MIILIKSDIHGCGIASNSDIKKGQIIAEIFEKKDGKFFESIAGRFTNHSEAANAEIMEIGNFLYLKAKKDIARHEEITADYRELIKLYPIFEPFIKFWQNDFNI